MHACITDAFLIPAYSESDEDSVISISDSPKLHSSAKKRKLVL